MYRWMRNRFVVLAAVLVIGIGLWNLYVAAHAHGLVAGRVVDPAGRPVVGATVRLYERDFVNEQERAHTITDAAGLARLWAAGAIGARETTVVLLTGPGAKATPRIAELLEARE